MARDDGERGAAGIVQVGADGRRSAIARPIAAEVPVAISLNGIGYAVMMATPGDLEDFGRGFAHGERLITRAADIVEIRSHATEAGILLDIVLVPALAKAAAGRVRNRIGDSSCGICGVENLETALRPLPRLAVRPQVGMPAIFAALAGLRDHQPLNAATGAVHAAAFSGEDGRIVVAREDVGRHNALDKLVGALLLAGIAPAGGAVLLSSRCSYELVEKTVLLGCPLLVTVSAATSLARARASEAGLTLVALARADSVLVMTDPHGMFG